jgi:hypothetical protein
VKDVCVCTRTHDEGEPHIFKENRTDAEEHVGQADHHEEDEPDPDDEIHLLVDDVLRKDAKAVVVLLTAGRAHVGHGAADVGGEGSAVRIDAVALLGQRQLRVHENVPAVCSTIKKCDK